MMPTRNRPTDFKEKQAEAARRKRRQSPQAVRVIRRRAHLKSAYGMTPEQHGALFESQDSCCAICKSREPGSLKGWHTDHCHKTGKVRGILCHHCNLTVGHSKDDEQRLLDIVFYLAKHKGDK